MCSISPLTLQMRVSFEGAIMRMICILLAVLLPVSVSFAQFGYDCPFGGSDYYFTWRDAHELYWQVESYPKNLITNIDYMEVAANSSDSGSCTYYFMVDRDQDRLVYLHSEGLSVEPSWYGSYLGPSRVGRISDLLVCSSYGDGRSASHDIYLCDESRDTVIQLRMTVRPHDSEPDDQMSTISMDKWPTATMKPRKIEYVDAGMFALVDAATNSVVIVNSNGAVVSTLTFTDGASKEIAIRDLAVWKGRDQLWNIAVSGYTEEEIVLIYKSTASTFSSKVLHSESVGKSPIVSMKYAPHIGLIALHANGYTDVYDNTEIWATNIDTSWNFGGEGTVNCIAPVGNRVHLVPSFDAGQARDLGVSRAVYLDGTSVTWPDQELFVDLHPVDLSYKVNSAGTYSMQQVIYNNGQVTVRSIPGLDYSIGRHEPEVWLPQLSGPYYTKFRLRHYDSATGSTSYFETNMQRVYCGPRMSVVAPSSGARVLANKPFEVAISVEYDDVVLPEVFVRLENEYGDTAASATLEDVGSGQHACTLIAPALDLPCDRGEGFQLRAYATYGGGSTVVSLPQSVTVRTKPCEVVDPPVPSLRIDGRTLVGGESVFVEYFKLLRDGGRPAENVSVFDVRGRRVFVGSPASLAPRDMPAGLYFLSVEPDVAPQRVLLLK